jgi:hypothetical protein
VFFVNFFTKLRKMSFGRVSKKGVKLNHRYEILSELSENQREYSVRDLEDGVTKMLKQLPNFDECVVQEAQILISNVQLSSFLIKYLDFFDNDGDFFLITEYPQVKGQKFRIFHFFKT